MALPLLFIAGGLAVAALFCGDSKPETHTPSPEPSKPREPMRSPHDHMGEAPGARSQPGTSHPPHRHHYPPDSPSGTPCTKCGKPKVMLPCHLVKRGKDKTPRKLPAAPVATAALPEPTPPPQ